MKLRTFMLRSSLVVATSLMPMLASSETAPPATADMPVSAQATQTPAVAEKQNVALETNYGKMVIELFSKTAPKTVQNFLNYVKKGFYNGLNFHRVIDGFMIQGGGFTPNMQQKPTDAPVVNESQTANSMKNKRGTISMARLPNPDSATSQFFINLVDNNFLDGNASKAGYTVFGHVVQGMDIVDKIAKVETSRKGGHGDVPVKPVIIEKAYVVK